MFKAGDQVPVIPLVDVVGKGAIVPPAQTADTAAKLGVTIGLTVIVKVCVVAHCPPLAIGVGVKAYVVVAVLFSAGDHVPDTPLMDVVGNGANVPPEQILGTVEKVGVNG